MSLFAPPSLPDREPSDEAVAQALVNVKRQVRDRRIALVAPVVLAAAVLVAFVAAPPRHGGLTLVPDAEANDEVTLPRVFGANGVWRLAEPIGDPQPTLPGPPWQVDVPEAPATPDFALSAPSEPRITESLPASASTPPTPTLGQTDDEPAVDWAAYRPDIRLQSPSAAIGSIDGQPTVPASQPDDSPTSADSGSVDVVASPDADTEGSSDGPSTDATGHSGALGDTSADNATISDAGADDGAEPLDATDHDPEHALSTMAAVATVPGETASATGSTDTSPATTDLAPDASDSAEAVVPPDHSSSHGATDGVDHGDDDVSGLREEPGPSGDAAAPEPPGPTAAAADTERLPEANPSTPLAGATEQTAQPSSTVATIAVRSVLVHSAHVSVTVWVGDDDSSVIDWCNTRVDWGDGSVSGLLGPDEVAMCAAPCEYEASPSGPGINDEITFEHRYTAVIDASPRIFVATGDGCSYTLAELQLNPFTVVPY